MSVRISTYLNSIVYYFTVRFVCLCYPSCCCCSKAFYSHSLFHAHTLAQYDNNLLHIKYGAAGLPATDIHYYNRNNFVSADFNPNMEDPAVLGMNIEKINSQ